MAREQRAAQVVLIYPAEDRRVRWLAAGLRARGATVVVGGGSQAALMALAPSVDLALTLDATRPGGMPMSVAAAVDRFEQIDLIVHFGPAMDALGTALPGVAEIHLDGPGATLPVRRGLWRYLPRATASAVARQALDRPGPVGIRALVGTWLRGRLSPASATGGLLLAGLFWTAPALACSGPGAEAAIVRAEWTGWALAALSGIVATLSTWMARRRGVLGTPVAASWVLVLAHPGIWMSARSGDCGASRVLGSVAFTLMLGGLVAWALLKPLPGASRPTGRAGRPPGRR